MPSSKLKYENYLGKIKISKRDEAGAWKKII